MYELLTGVGLALPAGLNAYIPLLTVALADRYTGLIQLAEPYDVISHPVVIVVLAILLVVELIADKVPLVDHVNDLIQSAIRPAAGAVLLMSSTEAVAGINPIAAMILGLIVAGGVHTAKTTFRPVVTATTGGLGNPVVSTAEDGAALGLTVIALVAPILVVFIVLAVVASFWIIIRRRRRRRHPAA
jgi:nucleoside recognition membrane protein YjiH